MIIGHQKQWQFLKRAFSNSRLAHAYLFSGPEQIGKKTLAFEFVKLINCQKAGPKEKACSLCSSCRMIEKGIHPDLVFLEPEPLKKEIQISQVRNLIEKLYLKPFLSPFKVAIIDLAHLMNAGAQHCILKTLEEPRGKTVLILISEHQESLLGTVRSRLQEIKFFFVSGQEMRNLLKRKGIEEGKLETMLNLCLGRPGRALDLLEKPEKIKKERELKLELAKMIDSDLNSRFLLAETLAQEFSQEILEAWLRYFREILFKGLEGKGINASLLKVKNVIREIEKTIYLISTTNINKRLALENLMLDL